METSDKTVDGEAPVNLTNGEVTETEDPSQNDLAADPTTKRSSDEQDVKEAEKVDSGHDSDSDGSDDGTDSDAAFSAHEEKDGVEPESSLNDATKSGGCRYEVTHLIYHLQKVEILWAKEEKLGPEWAGLWVLLNSFFRQDSESFRAWVSLVAQTQAWECPFFHRDFSTITPLHVASAYCLPGLAAMLLKCGRGDVSKSDSDKYQPLHYAADRYTEDDSGQQLKLQTLQLLIQEGKADVNAKSGYFTPFQMLLLNKPSIQQVELFLDHGAICWQEKTMWPPTHLYAQLGENLDIFKIILDRVPDINAKDEDGETPLHKVMQQYRQEPKVAFIKELMERKANVNSEDDHSQRKALFQLGKPIKLPQKLIRTRSFIRSSLRWLHGSDENSS
jgi:hypothetical protein